MYVQSLLLTLCQIVAFIAVYEVFWRLYIFLKPNFRRDLSWGLTVEFAVLIFAAISLVGAIIGKLLFTRHQLLVQWLCVFGFAPFFLATSWSSNPYRTSALLLCGVVGVLAPYFILKTIFPDRQDRDIVGHSPDQSRER
jgi:hypothetical protein